MCIYLPAKYADWKNILMFPRCAIFRHYIYLLTIMLTTIKWKMKYAENNQQKDNERKKRIRNYVTISVNNIQKWQYATKSHIHMDRQLQMHKSLWNIFTTAV